MVLKEISNLANRLRYIRKIKNLSQVELAKIAGTTQQAIQQAETGKARQPRYLHNLAMELEFPIEWVLFGKNQEKNTFEIKNEGFSEKSSEVVDSFFLCQKKIRN